MLRLGLSRRENMGLPASERARLLSPRLSYYFGALKQIREHHFLQHASAKTPPASLASEQRRFRLTLCCKK